MFDWSRCWLMLGILCCLFVTGGCATTQITVDRQSPLLTGERLLGYPVSEQDLPEHSFLTLTPEMREFVAEQVNVWSSEEERVQELAAALFDERGPGIQYDPLATQSVGETFLSRRANCLSFTAMFIALAREARLDAQFNEVEITPSWERLEANSYLSYRHINAAVKLSVGRQIIDLDNSIYERRHRQRTVSDRVVEAQYYSNLGVTNLDSGDLESAFLHLRKALDISQDIGFIWTNLGTVYRRAELFEESEQAFITALRIDPQDELAASNLAVLYQELGTELLADQYTEAAARYRNQNPYFRYDQAVAEFEKGHIELALEHIRSAVKLQPNDHRFHHLSARIYARLGELRKAKSSLGKAEKLAQDRDDQQRYQGKLRSLAAL